jgi:uncharacterized protein (DUF2062 family)
VKACVIIPCYNHGGTVAGVVRSAQSFAPVIVVDDGSIPPVPELPGAIVARLERNQGKGDALREAFRRAVAMGFTHGVTMDSDGQHSAEDLPNILEAAGRSGNALIVGVRNLKAEGVPNGRRRSNAISRFWFWVETGLRLADTQCGFRCYPLELTQRLRLRSGRYAYEMEFLVRASWSGTEIVDVPVACIYLPDHIRASHFRPVADFLHIAYLNVGWVLQAWFVPRGLREAWSQGKKRSLGRILHECFAENAHDPLRMSLAAGLGLFFGIAPIWGCQMIVATAVAHFLRLNKAITLLATNISIPPIMPLIFYGALVIGHWLFTGQWLQLSLHQVSYRTASEYLGQWAVGSIALGLMVAIVGSIITYAVATLCRKHEF